MYFIFICLAVKKLCTCCGSHRFQKKYFLIEIASILQMAVHRFEHICFPGKRILNFPEAVDDKWLSERYTGFQFQLLAMLIQGNLQ